MEDKILNRLGVVNFTLSLLIVFHHACTVDINFIGSFNPVKYGLNASVQRYMYNLSECAVPIFYFLSAYLFFRSFDGSWNQYKKKLSRRFFSLFIPYILFCTLGYLKHVIVSGELGGVIGWLSELWLCQTMPLWFIRELMALQLLAPLFYWIKKYGWLSIGISILIIILVTLDIVHYRSFVYWIPIYMMGANLKRNWWENLYLFVKKNGFIIFVILVSYLLICWFLPNGLDTSSYFSRLIYIIFRLFTPFVFIPFLITIGNSSIEVRKWMNYAFFVYCMHFPIITTFKLIYDKIVPDAYNFGIFKYVYIVILSYTICVIIAMFTEKYIPKVWHVINGGR